MFCVQTLLDNAASAGINVTFSDCIHFMSRIQTLLDYMIQKNEIQNTVQFYDALMVYNFIKTTNDDISLAFVINEMAPSLNVTLFHNIVNAFQHNTKSYDETFIDVYLTVCFQRFTYDKEHLEMLNEPLSECTYQTKDGMTFPIFDTPLTTNDPLHFQPCKTLMGKTAIKALRRSFRENRRKKEPLAWETDYIYVRPQEANFAEKAKKLGLTEKDSLKIIKCLHLLYMTMKTYHFKSYEYFGYFAKIFTHHYTIALIHGINGITDISEFIAAEKSIITYTLRDCRLYGILDKYDTVEECFHMFKDFVSMCTKAALIPSEMDLMNFLTEFLLHLDSYKK